MNVNVKYRSVGSAQRLKAATSATTVRLQSCHAGFNFGGRDLLKNEGED